MDCLVRQGQGVRVSVGQCGVAKSDLLKLVLNGSATVGTELELQQNSSCSAVPCSGSKHEHA